MSESDEITVVQNPAGLHVTVRPRTEPAKFVFLAVWMLGSLFFAVLAVLVAVEKPRLAEIAFSSVVLLMACAFIATALATLSWSACGREEWVFARDSVMMSRFFLGQRFWCRSFSARDVVNAGILDRRVRRKGRLVGFRQLGVVLAESRRYVGWGNFSVVDAITINPQFAERLKELGYPLNAEGGSYSVL